MLALPTTNQNRTNTEAQAIAHMKYFIIMGTFLQSKMKGWYKMSRNEILDKVFEATAKLELMQVLLGDLIDTVEDRDAKTPEGAMYFASQQDKIGSFLHIALDGVFYSIKLLEETQQKGGTE